MDVQVDIDPSPLNIDCFVRLPPRLAYSLYQSFLHRQNFISDSNLSLLLPLSIQNLSSKTVHYVAWTGASGSHSSALQLSLRFAELLGLKQGDWVRMIPVPGSTKKDNADSADALINGFTLIQNMTVEVQGGEKDWEVVCSRGDFIETHILNQIRLVYLKLKFPIRLPGGSVVTFQVTNLNPECCTFGVLSYDSEIYVTPPTKGAHSNGTNAELVKENLNHLTESHDPNPTKVSDPLHHLLYFRLQPLPRDNPITKENLIYNFIEISPFDERKLRLKFGDECKLIAFMRKPWNGPCTNWGPLRRTVKQDSKGICKDFKTIEICTLVHVNKNIKENHVWISKEAKALLQMQTFDLVAVIFTFANESTFRKPSKITLYKTWPTLRDENDDIIIHSNGSRKCDSNGKDETCPKMLLQELTDMFSHSNSVCHTGCRLSNSAKSQSYILGMNDEESNIAQFNLSETLGENYLQSKHHEDYDKEYSIQDRKEKESGATENISFIHMNNESEASTSSSKLYLFDLKNVESERIKFTISSKFALLNTDDHNCWGLGPRTLDVCGRSARKVVKDIVSMMRRYYSYWWTIPESRNKITTSFLTKRIWPGNIVGLCGPSGSGRTHLASAIAKKCRESSLSAAKTIWIRCRVHANDPAEQCVTRILNAFTAARRCGSSLIVLDDIDFIAESSDDDNSRGISRGACVGSLLADLLETSGLLGAGILMTAKSRDALHNSLLGKGDIQWKKIEPPDCQSRAKMLISALKWQCGIIDSVDSLDEALKMEILQIAKSSEGYVALDFYNIVDRGHRIFEAKDQDQDKKMTAQDLSQAFKSYIPIAVQSSKTTVQKAKEGEFSFKDVGGMDSVKNSFRELLELPIKHASLFSKSPLRLQSGALLYGPPGCGKTFIAKCASVTFGIRIITIKGPELLNKYIGASESAVRDAFSRAAAARPCILFFDEFESIAPRRGGDTTGVSDRVVNTLLTSMDGVEELRGVFVLGATSRPDLVDPALLRPGRLDRWLLCDFPKKEERKEILKKAFCNVRCKDDIDVDELAKASDGFSGADLKSMVSSAYYELVQEKIQKGVEFESEMVELDMEQMRLSLRNSRPSLSEKERKWFDSIATKFAEGIDGAMDGASRARVAFK